MRTTIKCPSCDTNMQAIALVLWCPNDGTTIKQTIKNLSDIETCITT